MIKYFLLAVLLLMTNANITIAQKENSNNSIGQTFLGDVEHFFDVGIGLASSPFSFSANDWHTVGIVAGGTASLFLVDKNIRTFALSNQSEINDKIFYLDNFMEVHTLGFSQHLYMVSVYLQKIKRLESLDCKQPKH